MNIFYLDESPQISAISHNDKHVRKMIIEYAQILSTAHRVIDGEEYYDKNKAGHKIKRWKLNDWREEVLYKATHYNHPSAVWVRESLRHYEWTYQLFRHLCYEFGYRWNKQHKTAEQLLRPLATPPSNLKDSGWCDPPQAMEDEYKMEKPIDGYKNYYIHGKSHLAEWTVRDKPCWYEFMS